MPIIDKISRAIFGGETKSDSGLDAPGFPFTDESALQRYDLTRPMPPLRYDNRSALQVYNTHELVYACINKRADVMNDVDIIVEVKNAKGEWEAKPGHPLTTLFRRPNQIETGKDFRRMMIQSEQTTGIFYAEITRAQSGWPIELHPLNPVRVRPWPDFSKLTIAFYRYTRVDGKFYDILPENMLIRRRSDITNRFFGSSPLEVALKSINSDLGLTDYIDAFFQSDGTPSGILKILNKSIPDEKKESLAALWRRKYSRNGSNHKGVAVLDQDAEFQRIGANLNELDMEKVSDRFETRICSVFGVPPILIDAWVGLRFTRANATAKAALRDFWDNTIQPELSCLREWLTWVVLPEFEGMDAVKAEKVRVGFDISHVGFLQEDADGLHTRTRENFKAGLITLNEARQSVGEAPDALSGPHDYYIQPLNVRAVTPEQRAIEASQAAPAPPPPPPSTALAVTDPNAVDATPPKSLEVADLEKKKKSFDHNGITLSREPVGVELLIDFKRIADDQDTEAQRLQKIVARIRLALIAQACDEIDAIDKAGEVAHTLTLVPDAKWRKEIIKVLTEAHGKGKSQVVAELNAQMPGKAALLTLATKDIADDETWLEYLDELTDGLISRIIADITTRTINQYSIFKLLGKYTSGLLRTELEGQSEKLMELAAANTVNAAVQDGRREAGDSLSDEWAYRQWSAAMDVNTCVNCEEWDSETDPPRDDMPDAPLGDCLGGANCRCILIFIAKDEAIRD